MLGLIINIVGLIISVAKDAITKRFKHFFGEKHWLNAANMCLMIVAVGILCILYFYTRPPIIYDIILKKIETMDELSYSYSVTVKTNSTVTEIELEYNGYYQEIKKYKVIDGEREFTATIDLKSGFIKHEITASAVFRSKEIDTKDAATKSVTIDLQKDIDVDPESSKPPVLSLMPETDLSPTLISDASSINVLYGKNLIQLSPERVDVFVTVNTSSAATLVTIDSSLGEMNYGPFNMRAGDDNKSWWFNANFYEKGSHLVTITVYYDNGQTAVYKFTYVC